MCCLTGAPKWAEAVLQTAHARLHFCDPHRHPQPSFHPSATHPQHYSGAVASASQASTSGPPGPSSSPTATTATTGTTSQPHLSATPTQPEAAARGAHTEDEVDITFTATTSASGSLLVGSSREFSGYDNAASPAIVVGCWGPCCVVWHEECRVA